MQNAERCMELLELAPGWLDGEAVPPIGELLELVGAWLDEHQLRDLEQPRLFPTPEGGVEAEWHQLDLDSGAVVEQQVVLQDNPGMRRLGMKLEQVLTSSNQSNEPEEAAG